MPRTYMEEGYEEVFPHVYRHKDTGEIYTDIEPRAIE